MKNVKLLQVPIILFIFSFSSWLNAGYFSAVQCGPLNTLDPGSITMTSSTTIIGAHNYELNTPSLSGETGVCDGQPCSASGTGVAPISFTVMYGIDSSNELIISSATTLSNIDEDYNYIEIKADTTLTDVTLRSSGNFIADSATLTISGDVVIHVDGVTELKMNEIHFATSTSTLTVLTNSDVVFGSALIVTPSTHPPTNFQILTKGNVAGTGSGSILRALIYAEGTVTLGSDSQIYGSVTSQYIITGSNSYIDASKNDDCDADDDTPIFKNTYSCSIFTSVLTTHDSLHVGENHPSNSGAICNTTNLAYPDGGYYGDNTLSCDPDGCDGGTACDRIDPPPNKLEYTVIESTKLGDEEQPPSVTLTDYMYGDFNGNFDLTLAPSTTYGNSIPVMVFGDVTLTGGNTISLEPGDYYFHSLTFTDNSTEIILPNGGDVRIFIEKNWEWEKNNALVNVAGNAGDLFVYIRGDLIGASSGMGSTTIKAFFYVEGSVSLYANTSNFDWYGGITSEGPIYIEGNNPEFIQTDDSAAIGYGECTLCFKQPHNTAGKVSTGFLNNKPNAETLQNLVIQKVYSYHYDPYTVTAHSVTTGTSAVSSVTVDIDGLAHFPNPTTTDGFKYSIGDYDPGQLDTVTDTTNIPFDLSDYNTSTRGDLKALYIADYREAGRDYHVMVDRCGPFSAETSYLTGPFNAWDTFRNIGDRNISTKIASKAYEITIASLNAEQDTTELKPGIDIEYSLVDQDTNVKIMGPFPFNADAFASINTGDPFPVPTAHKRVAVEFEVCADYDGTIYTFYSHGDAQCTGSTPIPANTQPGDVRFRLFYASDLFSVRPKEFNIAFDTPGQLTSGITYNLTTNANDNNDAPTENYAQNSNNIIMTPILFTSDNVLDTGGLMSGAITPSTEVNFVDGLSSLAPNNNALDTSFSDVGQMQVHLEDKNWAAVDFDDSPNGDCTTTGTFNGITHVDLENALICGDGTRTTFIPDHFKVDSITLTNHRGASGNFTYLSNDLNMSAHVAVNITAENAANAITTNFDANPLLYGNTITVDLNVTDWITPAVASPHPTGQPLRVEDISTPRTLAFAAGTVTSTALMFNYERDDNPPTVPLPFDVPGGDVNVTVASNYAASTIGGTGTGAGAAKFFYARAKSAKANDYYDAVAISTTISTPIQVLIYCQDDTCLEAGPSVAIKDTSSEWWIMEDHDQAIPQNDGNISLALQIAGIGAVTPADPAQVIISASSTDATLNKGENENVTVTCPAVASLLSIDLATATNSWLTFKTPLYQVECIAPSNWTGLGDTGHVVDTGASTKTIKKLSW